MGDYMNKLATLTANGKHLKYYWFLLMAMTLINAAIAEQAEPSLLITIMICAMIVIKARLVIDHFMELKSASPYIYHMMNAYFYIFPLVAVLVWLYPETLAEWTSLGP